MMAQELEVLTTVDHPNIVRVIEILEDDINFYIVTELIQGGELYDRITTTKAFSETYAATIVK